MSLLEGIANVNVRYTPSPSLTFSANLNYPEPHRRTGLRRLLSVRRQSRRAINELWVPTQYYTYNFGTGVEYAKNGWLLGFQYQGSFFQDVNDTLTWDNPPGNDRRRRRMRRYPATIQPPPRQPDPAGPGRDVPGQSGPQLHRHRSGPASLQHARDGQHRVRLLAPGRAFHPAYTSTVELSNTH